jgi:hypothetical protein
MPLILFTIPGGPQLEDSRKKDVVVKDRRRDEAGWAGKAPATQRPDSFGG